MTLIYSCDSSKSSMKGVSDSNAVENDTIHISNPELEYEIIDPFSEEALQDPLYVQFFAGSDSTSADVALASELLIAPEEFGEGRLFEQLKGDGRN